MNYKEYKNRSDAVNDYYEAGKTVKLSDALVTMMSVDERDAATLETECITPLQLPIIMCVYTNHAGNLMEVCIEWSDLDALAAMNDD